MNFTGKFLFLYIISAYHYYKNRNFIKFIKITKKFHKYLDFLYNMGYNVNKLNNTTQFSIQGNSFR